MTATRALVTGAFGFIGGHMVRRLVELGADVVALDADAGPHRRCQLNLAPELREHATVVEGDVTDAAFLDALLARRTFDVVFHFATSASVVQRAHADPLPAIHSASMGAVHLIEALHRGGQRGALLVHASTDKVYGDAGDEPYREHVTPLSGAGVYEASKVAADVLVRALANSRGRRGVVARLCNVFGPYDLEAGRTRLVPSTMTAALGTPRRRPIVYAHAQQHRRDYLYVDDACRAMLLLAEHAARDASMLGQAFNVCGVANLTSSEMCLSALRAAAAAIEDEAPQTAAAILADGFDLAATAADAAHEIAEQRCCGEQLRARTGFAPQVDLVQGLRRTADSYRTVLGG